MSHLVTIMIPAYNQPQYIEQAVKSALSQDYRNIEVIVSDDSSNDETTRVLQPYLTDSRFFYYKNEKNIGRVDNYRKLLYDLAKGEWVVMLDGDDYYIDRTYISRVMEVVAGNEKIVLAGAGIKIFNEASNTYESFGLGNQTLVFDGEEVFSKYQRLPNHQTAVYLRKLACELNFYRDPSAGSDSESLYRLVCHGKVFYLAEEVAVWRVHNQNTTYTRNIGKQVKEIVFLDRVYKYAVKFIDADTIGKWRNNQYRFMALHLLDLSLASGKKLMALNILTRFGRFLGVKLSIVYFLRMFGLYTVKN